MATDDDAIQTSEDFAARKLAEQDKTSDAPKPPDTSTPASDKRSYRSYEEYPWEGHSSQYGPLNNPLGEGYGIGLGPVLQERYNAPVGSWVYVPPYGWRQVNETSAAKGGEGIELFTKTKGSVPEQLAIEAVSHSTPEGQTPAPGMDGKLHMASGYNLDYPATREPNQAEGLYGAEEAEAQIGEAELKELEDKQAKENDNPLSPQSVVRTLKSQNADYKDVPDQKLYQAFKQRYPGGVDQLTALYPDYKTVDTGVLLKAVKERWYPNDNNDEFIDRMQPTNVLHNISEQLPRIVPSFYEHTANLAKTPENFATFMSPILRALGIDPGKGTPDWLKTLGIDPAHNVQIRGYTGADAGGDAQRKITQGLYNWATRFATKGKKWEDAHHMPKPHEVIGQTTANISGALGAAPEAAISFLPLGGSVTLGRVVIPHVVGLAIGMGYDALQAYSKYREAGMDKALLQSSEGATVRFLEQFLAYTPRGRILSAFFYHGAGWAGVATADQEAKTFIDNWGKPKEQQITLSANDRISTAATTWLLGGLFSLTAERMPEAAQESLSEAVQARDAGNQALQATLLDRTMYLLPDAQRKAVGNNLLAWRNEAIEAKPGDAPMEMPGARGFQIIKPSEVNLPRAPQAPIEGAIEARPLDQPQPPGVILAPWHAREQAPSPFTAERVGADPARVEPGIGSLELGEVPLKREEAPKVEEAKPTEVKAPAPKIEPSAKGVRAVQIPAVSPELEQVPFDPEKGQLEHLEHLRSLQPPRSPLSPIPRRGRGVDQPINVQVAETRRAQENSYAKFKGLFDALGVEVIWDQHKIPMAIELGGDGSLGLHLNPDKFGATVFTRRGGGLQESMDSAMEEELIHAAHLEGLRRKWDQQFSHYGDPENRPISLYEFSLYESDRINSSLDYAISAAEQRGDKRFASELKNLRENSWRMYTREVDHPLHPQLSAPELVRQFVQLRKKIPLTEQHWYQGILDTLRDWFNTALDGFKSIAAKLSHPDLSVLNENIERTEAVLREIGADQDVPRGTKSPSDHITDQLYYSGIDLRLLSKLAEDIGETELGRWLQASGTKARNWGGIARDLFSPEHVTPAREASAAVIGRNIGVMQRDQQRIMQTWWQQQKLHDDIRFAYSADRRSAFWQSRKRGELMTWLERHESGRSTGNPVADRMFKQHDALMGWLNTLEQQQGFVHGIRDSYIYHALENPGDIGALSETLKKNGWADPDFMHHRELPTIEDVHRFGFRLKTYNLEKLDQMRFESYLRTKMKADTLDWLRTAKLAYTDRDFANMRISLEAQGKAIGMAPDEVDARIDKFIGSLKSQTQEWRSPRAVKNVSTGELEHERFWVLGTKTDGPSFMLHRATDPVQWSIFEPVVNGALTIKQRTTAPVLGWSAYHHLHMLPIMASDTITHALHQTLRGRATLEDWKWASADAFSLGLATHIRSLYENQKVLNVYLHPGEVRYKDLSPYEQKVFTLWERGGFVPQISHERQIALGQFLIGQKGLNVDKVADLGYAALTCRPYQRWLFGRSIPSMKAHAYTQRTFALLDARPELNRSENWLKLDIELRKIAREVDDRFGEQNLRQSFTSPYVKTLGQAYFLSYSWQKSFLGVNGGAIHDLTKVPRHFQEILKGTPEERAGIISNKLLYGMTMNLYTMGVNLLISQLLGAGVKSLVDAIYPNIGYDGQGRLKRSKPPFWVTTEIAGLTRHLGDDGLVFGALGFFANKQQAALSTLFSLIANRDYFGTQISPQGAALGFIPKDAPPFSTKWWNEMGEQLWTKAEFALKNEISMSVQQALQPGMTWRDRLLGFAGIARAPSSAERSAVENEIIHTWVATKAPRERTREAGQQIEAKHNYRVALLSKDQWSIDIAREQMRRLGISEDSMAAIEDHLDVSTAENLFPKLYPEDQERILRSMHQDDFSKFYDLASEDVQDKVSNFHPSK